MADPKPEDVERDFREAVNMTAAQIERHLATGASRSVGTTRDGEDESVGHASGRRIVEILRKPRGDLTEDDRAHMRKVAGYVRRHRAQGGPDADRETSPWRMSLMNWGHDPLRDEG
jgi:hypothetical protein